MKKKSVGIVIIVLSLLFIFACVSFLQIGNKPFKHLKAADIVSAQMELSPPDETIQIADIEELIPYLNNLVVYGKDQSYTEYSGQSVIFTLVTTDGKQIKVSVYTPFVVIDGVGYKAKQEPCEALNHYAKGLAN